MRIMQVLTGRIDMAPGPDIHDPRRPRVVALSNGHTHAAVYDHAP